MKTILLILLQTILVGTVTDSETGEAIPNASVYYAGTHEGTTTDNEGAFYLRSAFERKRTLVVSAIGYRPERFAVEPNRTGGIEVALREQIAPLQEVTITPGVNPAFAIVDSVRKHKGDRQQATGDRQQATGDRQQATGNRQQATGDRQQATGGEKETVKLSLSNFTAKQLQRRLWKQFEPMMVDSLVTLYERIEEKGLRTEEKAYILTATDYQALIPDNSQLDFYQNNVSIANKAFLSPLASAGKMYYHYYLVESTAASSREEEGRRIEEEGNQTLDTKHQTPIVRLDFKTKNPFYPTFNGSMWVDTVAWTITRLEADIPRNNAVNYLTGGRVKQSYVNGQLTDEYVATVMDFAIKQDSSHIWPSVLVEQRRQATGDRGQATGDRQQATGDRGQATGDRRQGTGDRGQATGDSPPLPPSLRFASWLGQIIGTGYIPTGTAIDFGHVQEILQVNETEGVHVGIPLRTNERLWKNVSLEAAMGYGFKNRQFTGLGKVSFNLPTLRRNILSVEYRDHYVWQEVDDFTALMRENGVGYKTMDFTSYAFEALRSNKQAVNSMVRRRQFQIATENDWDEHVETQFYLRIGQIDGETLNRSQGELNDGMRNFFYAITGGIVRVGFGERKVDSYFRRVHVYSHYPVIYGGVECGMWNVDGISEGHVYGKFTLMVRQTVNLGMGGELDYVAQVGTMVGQVPFTLLHHFEGNQGYAYDPYRFTLMNNLQYNAKHFCALHLSWNGQGVLFNLIPGVRYLRLRELVTFKLAANLQATGDWLQATGDRRQGTGDRGQATGDRRLSPSTPYIEIGCGIGNILRVAELHSVWRLTNREDTTTPRWALRFRIHLGL
ncbi:MAG: DUF5686 and carboxypeptidase regulatory-like domain-containing protein [Paludibacteraceae bacterium]|nr:DUF5686 and carboxypeptidase regulatory-like domain-containing protein [Paludibacteraceae bacterium]